MEAIKIEILNPKALKLIKGMQDLELIRISEEPGANLKNYLNKVGGTSSRAALRKKRNRKGWEQQIKSAIAEGDHPDDSPFENIKNEWDNSEWTWPE